MSAPYLALLRGINVGGRNRILMADLRARLGAAGYEEVRTYIQSGNVLFRSDVSDREELRHAIEGTLAEAFDYAATVELRSRAELQATVDQAPPGIDAAWPGPGVVYITRVVALASKSGLSRIASHPAYKRMTIRNWNTTATLLAMMDEG